MQLASIMTAYPCIGIGMPKLHCVAWGEALQGAGAGLHLLLCSCCVHALHSFPLTFFYYQPVAQFVLPAFVSPFDAMA